MKKYEVSMRVSRDDNSKGWGKVRAMVFANDPHINPRFDG